jgi:proteasome lid subunit RPN8/RPN11
MAAAIRLRREHVDSMIDHAKRDAPIECCGLLASRDGEVVSLHPARNRENSPYRFDIDPLETKKLLEIIEASGADLAGFYHSHTGSAAVPSPTDIRMMGPLFGPPYVTFCRRPRRSRQLLRSRRLASRTVAGPNKPTTSSIDGALATPALRRPYRHPAPLRPRARIRLGHCTFACGIINVTPDSFSGDGIAGDVPAAVALARDQEAAGAQILDIGGESTRPDARPLDPGEEARRVLPALAALREATALPISIDTMHANVAEAAFSAGADILNDVSGLRHDSEIAAVAARHGAPVVAMHNQRGRPVRDVAADITAGFEASLEIAAAAGIDAAHLILDPGFGFG